MYVDPTDTISLVEAAAISREQRNPRPAPLVERYDQIDAEKAGRSLAKIIDKLERAQRRDVERCAGLWRKRAELFARRIEQAKKRP